MFAMRLRSLGSLLSWLLMDEIVCMRCFRGLTSRLSLGGCLLNAWFSLRASSVCDSSVVARSASFFA